MLLDRIKTTLEKHHAMEGRVGIADIDELLLLINAAEAELPKRFLEVARSVEVGFDPENPSWHSEKCERLLRILEVSATLPQNSVAGTLDEILPTFALPKEDKVRVLDLCSQMRKIVLATVEFDQPHKRRLLNRIAGIEYQVEQPKGLFDVVRNGVSDVGETLGKFGTDIKPLTDRMKEVADIVRRNTKEYDQIPAPTEVKKLPKPEEPDDGEEG